MSPDEALDRLHRAGWSVGETAAVGMLSPAREEPE
jgi:hypothetical protein